MLPSTERRSKYQTIKLVLKEVDRIALSGFTYDGKRKEGQGRDPIIDKGSRWESMIVDYKEGGMSFPDV